MKFWTSILLIYSTLATTMNWPAIKWEMHLPELYAMGMVQKTNNPFSYSREEYLQYRFIAYLKNTYSYKHLYPSSIVNALKKHCITPLENLPHLTKEPTYKACYKYLTLPQNEAHAPLFDWKSHVSELEAFNDITQQTFEVFTQEFSIILAAYFKVLYKKTTDDQACYAAYQRYKKGCFAQEKICPDSYERCFKFLQLHSPYMPVASENSAPPTEKDLLFYKKVYLAATEPGDTLRGELLPALYTSQVELVFDPKLRPIDWSKIGGRPNAQS